jgi:hypothetical protein
LFGARKNLAFNSMKVLNPWDVHSIEAVVAGGDGRQEVVGDKAPALK